MYRSRMTGLSLILAIAGIYGISNLAGASPKPWLPDRSSLPSCEWCGADEAPDRLSWKVKISPADEPGERLVITGTVYGSDGKTRAEGVMLYAYHTNQEGVYPKRGDETGNGRRHGYLRGWLRTNQRGEYRIDTIRPATYPSRNSPAHIHMTVKEPDKPEYWIDSIKFEGDPLLTPEMRSESGIVELVRDGQGTWRATRDIVLRP